MIRSLRFGWPLNDFEMGKSWVSPPMDRATWQAFWTLVASMHGLERLRVILVRIPQGSWVCDLEHRIEVLQPLCAVQHLDRFEVNLPPLDPPEHLDHLKETLSMAPFVLEIL